MHDIVLIHGFAGSAGSWSEVIGHLDRERYRPLAIDLPGHGDAAGVEPAGYRQAAREALAACDGPLLLCGYSLGARVALAAALAEPDRVRGLLLVSAHAGIEDPVRRAERANADAALAARIESMDAEQFAEFWNAQPIFAGEDPRVHELARRELTQGNPAVLAASLRVLGPARFEPVWDRLAGLALPFVALAGEQDAPYPEHARRMADLAGGVSRLLPGRHRQHLENPALLAGELEALDAEAG